MHSGCLYPGLLIIPLTPLTPKYPCPAPRSLSLSLCPLTRAPHCAAHTHTYNAAQDPVYPGFAQNVGRKLLGAARQPAASG